MALSDIIQPRLSVLGKIKIGRKGAQRTSEGGKTWSLPEKLDHFLITGLGRDQAGQLLPDVALMEALKTEGYADKDGKLRRLPISVLSNDPEDILQASYCWYGGKICGARSDGVTVTWFCDPKSGKRLDEPLVEDWTPENLERRTSRGDLLFKKHVNFRCVIASKSARWGGVYEFRTTSEISSSQLYGNLLLILQLTGGILLGRPLQLVVRPIQVSPTNNKGEQIVTTAYVVHCELLGDSLKKIQEDAMDQARFMVTHKVEMERSMTQYRKLLAPPGTEDAREQEDINEEFHPETVVERVEVSEGGDPLFGEEKPEEKTPAEATQAPQEASKPEVKEEKPEKDYKRVNKTQVKGLKEMLALYTLSEAKFLDYYQVKRLEDLPAEHYNAAVEYMAMRPLSLLPDPPQEAANTSEEY